MGVNVKVNNETPIRHIRTVVLYVSLNCCIVKWNPGVT